MIPGSFPPTMRRPGKAFLPQKFIITNNLLVHVKPPKMLPLFWPISVAHWRNLRRSAVVCVQHARVIDHERRYSF